MQPQRLIHSAAQRLQGVTLNGGWVVQHQIAHASHGSGSTFGATYIAQRTVNGQQETGFLKAMDLDTLTRMNPNAPVTDTLKLQTTHFNFERDLLRSCQLRRMNRIVTVIDAGEYHPAQGYPVPYLIFELADRGNLRNHLAQGHLDLLWKLECSKDLVHAVKQLHSGDNPISHQDIKPSNLLIDSMRGGLLGDLGRAVPMQGINAMNPFAMHAHPGDRNYAPPEILYGFYGPDFQNLRLPVDLYQVGALISFVFTQHSLLARLFVHLDQQFHHTHWRDTFEAVLPHLEHAHSGAVAELTTDLEATMPVRAARNISALLARLCNPDPRRRGHPNNAQRSGREKLNLERDLSMLAELVQRAKHNFWTTP